MLESAFLNIHTSRDDVVRPVGPPWDPDKPPKMFFYLISNSHRYLNLKFDSPLQHAAARVYFPLHMYGTQRDICFERHEFLPISQLKIEENFRWLMGGADRMDILLKKTEGENLVALSL
jgi:hypothetical protein